MNLVTGEFKIVSYRDFYDVPRLMLAKDMKSNYWIFDCAFDANSDDYPSNYTIYFAASELKDAEDAMLLHLKETNLPLVGVAPVESLEFDPTKKHAFRLAIAHAK